MHCINCGAYIASGARFCAGCGAPAVDPELTRIAPSHTRAPARKDESGEAGPTIFVARPTLIFIKAGYVAAALGAILLTALLASITSLKLSAFISIPIALSLLLIPAYYHLKRNTVRYTLTDSEIEIDQGLIARTTRNIPLRTIQDVTVRANIPQRLLGYGDVIVDNASEQGGTIILRNIHDPRRHADLLLRELRRWR